MLCTADTKIITSLLQRSFEVRLEKRFGEMQASQHALNSSLSSIQAVVNQLAETLPGILHLLEANPGGFPEHEVAGRLQASSRHRPGHWQKRAKGPMSADGRLHSLPPRQSSSVDATASESESDRLAQSKTRPEFYHVEQEEAHISKAPQQILKRGSSGVVTEKIETAEPEKIEDQKILDEDTLIDAAGQAESGKGAKTHREPSNPLKNAPDMMLDSELGVKLACLEKMLEQITKVIVVKNVCEGDDDEDRRRLKEKLKLAIEADRRSRIRPIVSRAEVWLQYIFGICQPDRRIGRRGSR